MKNIKSIEELNEAVSPERRELNKEFTKSYKQKTKDEFFRLTRIICLLERHDHEDLQDAIASDPEIQDVCGSLVEKMADLFKRYDKDQAYNKTKK